MGMVRKTTLCAGVVLFIVFYIVQFLNADGVLLVRDPDNPSPTPLSVSYHRVSVQIHDGVAVTKIDQAFINSSHVDLEAEYIFPIPEKAAIGEFSLYVNGKRMGGEMLDHERARRIYERIVREMKDPGLLEYVGRDMFRARVYPVPANGKTRIELEYSEIIPYDNGVYAYRYPLDTERFSPTPLEEVSIAVEIHSGVPVKSIYSPSHDVDMEMNPHGAVVGYEERDVRPDKDFLLFYTVAEQDLGINVLSFRETDREGYFMLMLSPGDLEAERQSKDVVFVFDSSGSMSGEKIAQARHALRYCIESLDEHDRFGIVQFATHETLFRKELVPARGRNIADALGFVDRMRARGGTNINDALASALRMLQGSDRPRMVVFLTDGEPTVGVTDLQDILENVAGNNGAGARFFVFGVGYDVNTHLLDRLSAEQRGVTEYVTPGQSIELKVSSFFRKISEPILSDISLDFGRVEVSETYPLSLPDIYRGTQLILLGRYRGAGSAHLELSGTVNGRHVGLDYEVAFASKNLDHDFIPRLWAMRKIGFLLSEIRLKGERQELVDEIVALSKEYGVMTPYTSYLVLEHEEDYDEWGIVESEEIVAGGRGFKRAMEAEKGEAAVTSSRDIDDLKLGSVAVSPDLHTIRHVGHKTFYLRDGYWIDSAYREGMRVRELSYLSKAYFRLLEKHPPLGRYFALSGNVVVVYEATCYRVSQ
jgi:Ca-activated chloride channel family protein